MRWTTAAFAIALWIALPLDAAAQGCSMCAQNASAAGSSGIRAIEAGIYVLLVPLLLILGGIVVLTLRSRNRYREEAGSSGSDGWERSPLPVMSPPEGEIEEEPVGVGSESGWSLYH
jgi:hypothetical protein